MAGPCTCGTARGPHCAPILRVMGWRRPQLCPGVGFHQRPSTQNLWLTHARGAQALLPVRLRLFDFLIRVHPCKSAVKGFVSIPRSVPPHSGGYPPPLNFHNPAENKTLSPYRPKRDPWVGPTATQYYSLHKDQTPQPEKTRLRRNQNNVANKKRNFNIYLVDRPIKGVFLAPVGSPGWRHGGTGVTA
jgi:hypothetical protein